MPWRTWVCRWPGCARQCRAVGCRLDRLVRVTGCAIGRVWMPISAGPCRNGGCGAGTGADAVLPGWRDRWARCTVVWIKPSLSEVGSTVEVMRERGDTSPVEELLEEVMAELASISGRCHRLRSTRNRRWLLGRGRGAVDLGVGA